MQGTFPAAQSTRQQVFVYHYGNLCSCWVVAFNRLADGGLSMTSSINGSACASYPGYWVTGLTLDPSGSSLYAGQGTSLDNCLSSFAVQGDGSLAFQSSIDIGLAEDSLHLFSSL